MNREEFKRPIPRIRTNSMTWDADKILDIITHTLDYKTRKYVILGKPGPTGKTWMCEQLKKKGCDAIEISEALACYISYEHDNFNTIYNDLVNNTIVIILNITLPQYRKDR